MGFKVFRLCAWICTTLEGKIQKIIIEKGHVAYVEVAVLCLNQLKNAQIASFSCFFQYFTPFFAFLSESLKIRCIFLQEKHVISIRKKVRKLLFLLQMAKHGLFPMFLFHFSVLNMDFSKLICQTLAFIIKKMHEMYCFHVFFKILAHVFSSLRFADA